MEYFASLGAKATREKMHHTQKRKHATPTSNSDRNDIELLYDDITLASNSEKYHFSMSIAYLNAKIGSSN